MLAFFAVQIDPLGTSDDLRPETLDRYLRRLDVPPSEREAVHDLLDACNEVQLTPAQPSYDVMEATLEHAQGLLLRLDDRLSSEAAEARA